MPLAAYELPGGRRYTGMGNMVRRIIIPHVCVIGLAIGIPASTLRFSLNFLGLFWMVFSPFLTSFVTQFFVCLVPVVGSDLLALTACSIPSFGIYIKIISG